jgi:hypothetical protein
LVLGGVVLIAVVFIAYFQALRVSFVGDDWIFFGLAARLSLTEYLVKYFDPRVQTAWYRPVQGVLFRIGYEVFRNDPMWYHLVNVLFHSANSLLLFALVTQTLRNWRTGFIAAVLFATSPLSALAVFWAGVIDPVTTLLSLLAISFWLRYLERESSKDYWLAFGAFLIALLSKEIAVTLPITLFLFDRFYSSKPVDRNRVLKRYVWYLIVWAVYAPLEYIVVQRSVFVHHEGYQPRLNVLTNFVDYLAGLAFPWKFFPPLSYLCLLVAALVLAYFIFARKCHGLLPVVVGAVLYVLPIVLFPEVSLRFAYASLAGSAVLFALLFERVLSRARRSTVLVALTFAAVTALVVYGTESVLAAAADFGEFGRVTRVPFRNVRQAHPNLPENTLVYFINPPLPGPNLSGMFFWYYGPRIHLAVDDAQFRGQLRDYPLTYVEYFDEGNQKEQVVDKEVTTRISPALPARFAEPILLEDYELVSAHLARDQALLLFLYWRALGPIPDDYTVFVHLLDQNGTLVAGYDKEPRRGNAPTSTWTLEEQVVDAVQLPLPAGIPTGRYRLELGLYNAASGQRVGVRDATGAIATDRLLIEPLNVVE